MLSQRRRRWDKIYVWTMLLLCWSSVVHGGPTERGLIYYFVPLELEGAKLPLCKVAV